MEIELKVIACDIDIGNSYTKDTEVFVQHVLSIHIVANIYVQVPQWQYIGSGPALRYEGIQKNRFTCKIEHNL